MKTQGIDDQEAMQRFADIMGQLEELKRTDKIKEVQAIRTLARLWKQGAFEEERGCALRVMERLITKAY